MNLETNVHTPMEPAQAPTMNHLGVVIIGRNEGERLRQCLTSVVGHGVTIVYVDSNSTDASVALAREMGVYVVELDMTLPFTAARAQRRVCSPGEDQSGQSVRPVRRR